jgi:diadenosine tetraphosphate (Ap4A) HIT family hydrolase
MPADCALCRHAGGVPVWQDAAWRVVRVDDSPGFPAFYRVIAQTHVREFSDLLGPERRRCMDLVCAVERVLIEQLRPTKINLAALGNVAPHLHWHVIARFDWDSHFPNPIWSAAQRDVVPPPVQRLSLTLDQLDSLVQAAVSAS